MRNFLSYGNALLGLLRQFDVGVIAAAAENYENSDQSEKTSHSMISIANQSEVTMSKLTVLSWYT
mgnify:CR=1 FL=1